MTNEKQTRHRAVCHVCNAQEEPRERPGAEREDPTWTNSMPPFVVHTKVNAQPISQCLMNVSKLSLADYTIS